MLIRLIFVVLFINSIHAQNNIIENIEFRGLEKTKEAFLSKIINAKPNTSLDSIVLDKDIARLKRLPLVAHAYYEIAPSESRNYKLIYHIEENFTLIPNVNIWSATNQNFAYRIGLSDFNFLGQGITFGGFYQNNGYNTYNINFKAPYLFSNKLGIAINHQDWKSEEPIFFENSTANYLYNNISFEVLGLFEINTRNRLQAGLNLFKENYAYLNGDIDDNIPRDLSINKVLAKLIYDFDSLDYHYQYVSGLRSTLYVQGVRSTNELQPDFFIAWNDFNYLLRIGNYGNWANRLRLGLSTNSDSPFAPFSVDNNLNIRGVGNIIDRGTGVIVINSEYRHTLFEKKWFCLQGNAFIDAGSWRNPGGSFDDFLKEDNLRIYPGLGLRFIHKKIYNAVFRIDYGYGISKNSSEGIVFGIGQYF